MRLQITHVRPDGGDLDRRIDALWAGGTEWKIDTAIYSIENGSVSFFVNVGGRVVDVIVRTHPTSFRKYLTTQGDGFPPNNLLMLPRF